MDRSSAALREGFLVKKSKGRHRWKTRWFVLIEDQLCYFCKKTSPAPMGSIKLTGAAVSFPVEGYEKRPGVFKLSDRKGKLYLLRAPTDEERNVWTHAISAAIRALGVVTQREPSDVSKELSIRVNLSDLLGAMQDQDAGVSLTTHCEEDIEYDDCFTGENAVGWLMEWKFASTRQQGMALCQDLLRLAHLQPLYSLARRRSDVAPEINTQTFYDNGDVYYRFSSMMRSPSQDCLFEASSESSGSSQGEKSEGHILDDPPTPKGKVIKEGFLMKKGHRRNRWKVRKVVVRDIPPCLEYYGTAQDDDDPLKSVSLDGCRALSVTDGQRKEFLNVSVKKKPHIFCIKCPEGRALIFQAENDHERDSWVKALSKVTQQP